MSYNSVILADSPVGYWPLGESSGTVAADLSVNNQPGAYSAGTVLGNAAIAMELGTSASFPGSSSMVVPADGTLYDFPTGSFSVEAWIRPTGLGGFQEFFSGGSNYRFLCTNNTLWVIVDGTTLCVSTAALSNNGTYYVVYVVDNSASVCSIYINGVLDTATGFSGTENPGTSNLDIIIGSLDGAGTQQYVGDVSNVAVYGTALNSTQVAAHYLAGTTAPSDTTVPNVLGLLDAAAQSAIVAASLVVGTVTGVASSLPIGTVLSQSPTGGTTVLVGSAVNLTEAQGVEVPNVVNTSALVVAPGILAAAGFVVGAVTYAPSGVIIAGNIISQFPSAGSFAAAGSAVNIVVSSGLPALTVPDLFGLTQADAIALLLSLGLVVGAVGSASSQFVPVGEVQQQNPTAGAPCAAGTVVSFVISLGQPATSTMFDFEATVISQYANSPTIIQLCQNLNQYIDQSANFANFYNYVWNVDSAVGFGLDIWGKIVNVSRLLQIPNSTVYAGFYQSSESQPDQDWTPAGSSQPPYNNPPVGGAMYTGNNANEAYLLPDDSYRQLILAKAFANICTTTAPAINQILQNIYGSGTAFVLQTGPMAISYNLTFKPTAIQLAILEQSGVIPTPPGVAVVINTDV